ncbi:MAG: hypothetical protein FJY80_01440, partial [Candidatus Aminicenantes bacterium]|nr:hypothetical protein [Candidatus Aminicenantes bacterium]
MAATALDRILETLVGAVKSKPDGVSILDEKALAGRMDALAREAVFGDGQTQAAARWLIWEAAQDLGLRPAS